MWSLLLSVGFLAASCGNKNKQDEAVKKNRPLPPINTELKKRLKEFASRPRMKGVFGFYVYDLTAQKPVYGEGQDTYMSSASCLKLITAVSGLKLLGPNYRYWSAIYTRGQISNGVLNGDVAFRGRMDPQLQAQDMNSFGNALKKLGIKKFTGKLIMDLAMTEPVKSEKHWYPWDLSFSRYGILFKGADKVEKALVAGLSNNGISVDQKQIVMGRKPNGSVCRYHLDHPIESVITKMLKNSANTQATSLLYTIGYKLNPKGDYAATGVNYLRIFVRKDLGITDKRLVLHDGCGLCTYNHLSPTTLVKVLRYAYADRAIYPVINRNLSKAGEDGTMKREFTNPILRGKVRAKTGTLSHPYGISSLAGYATASDGHELAFAIMDVDMSVLDAHVLQRNLCETLVK